MLVPLLDTIVSVSVSTLARSFTQLFSEVCLMPVPQMAYLITKLIFLRHFEVIFTVCHYRKSVLLLPTVTHFINTDNLYFSLTGYLCYLSVSKLVLINRFFR